MPSTRFVLAAVATLAAIVLPAARRPEPVTAAPHDTGSAAVAPSSTADQVDLAVTVYNSNLALVRDVREFAIQRRREPTCSLSTSPRP